MEKEKKVNILGFQQDSGCKSVLRDPCVQKTLARLTFLPASRWETDEYFHLAAVLHPLKPFATKLTSLSIMQDRVSRFRSSGLFLKELLSWPS